MPRQEAFPGQRSDVSQINTAMSQVPQFYETDGDRAAAFGQETIPDTQITHIGAPTDEDNRWQRWNGIAWVPAMLEAPIDCGFVNNIDITNRNIQQTRTATVRLNQPVPVGRTFTVQYQSVDGTAKVSEGDYTAIPLTTLTFIAGEREKTFNIIVPAVGAVKEPSEEFYIDLSNPSEGSINYLIGARLTVRLIGDTSNIIVNVANTTVNEGSRATTAISLNREVSGDFRFTWGTRPATNNPAPSSLYTAVADAQATIPEGSAAINVFTQTNELAGVSAVTTQNYSVVVNQDSLEVVGEDTSDNERIAATQTTLIGNVAVARNNVVSPNIFVSLRPQFATNPAVYQTMFVGNATGTGIVSLTSAGTRPFFNQPTIRANSAGWPGFTIAGTISPAAQVDSHFFYTITGIRLNYKTTIDGTNTTRTITREGRIDVKRGDTSWQRYINVLPVAGDGIPIVATYYNVFVRYLASTTATTRNYNLYTLILSRPSGVRFTGNAASLVRTYHNPNRG